MTKKYSYNLNKRQIEVNGHYFALCSVADHGNIVRMLNHYEKENEWLKFKLKECREYKLFSRRELEKENDELKQVLGSILIGVRRDISATNHSGEVKSFVNPNSFDLISNVLKKYGALKDWYE